MWTAPVRAPSGFRLTLAFDHHVGRRGVRRMSEDDVLFGYRLRVLDHAGRTSVSEACRVFGIHRSTFYVWKRRVERHGLEILRPRERRRPRMPQQLSPFVEERIVAFALGHPGYGPRRIASELRRERWGGIVVSHNGVWRCLRRHGLNTRQKRLALVAGYAAPYEPPREPQPERHVEAERPGELGGMDCFFVRRRCNCAPGQPCRPAPGDAPGGDGVRGSQGEDVMSRVCRHISVTGQPSR